MDNCDVWYTVDFGEGPVKIRCTRIGTHAEHETAVLFQPSPTEAKHNNIFEDKD